MPFGFGGAKTTPHNIIIFGESGAGKSSVVNMLIGRKVAATSNGGARSTKKSTAYNLGIEERHFKIYDTTGFDEGEGDRIPSPDAIVQLYKLLKALDGVSLLVYCMRGPRVKESAKANWKLFHHVICKEQVPIVAVVTGLEELGEKMDAWWPRNERVFARYGLFPRKVACITAIKGKRDVYRREYDMSRGNVKNMIYCYHEEKPWRMEKNAWWMETWKGFFRTFFGAWSSTGEEDLGDLNDMTPNDLAEECDISEWEAKEILDALRKEDRKRGFPFFR